MSELNLRKFKLSRAMTDAEAYNTLTSKAANCPRVKSIAARPDDDEPVLSGDWYKYTVDVKNEHVHVKPKLDVTKSMILTFICLPFALWFVWFTNLDGDDLMAIFIQATLPLAWMFISFGIVYTVAYVIGGKEQKEILPFIYNTLCGDNADKNSASGNTGMAASYVGSIVALIIGIVLLVLHFVLK